jgi:ABC-type branched-subunit amino acid transport system substrate-binding protein
MVRSTQTAGIRIVAQEKYNRNDPSVTGQVLKLLAAHPDAILIAGSGTPAATPHKELIARGYKGRIYQTHGVANADFLRVVGADGKARSRRVRCWYEQPLPMREETCGEYVTRTRATWPGRRTTLAAMRGTRCLPGSGQF